MFGPGRTYDLAGLALDDEPSLSCVAELSDGFDLTRAAELIASPDRRAQAVLPPLYRPPGFAPRFLPFVLRPGSVRATGAAQLIEQPDVILSALGDAVASCAKCGGPDGVFRLNFPIRSDTIDPAYPVRGRAARSVRDPALDPGKPIVIAAVIDDGIPFAHRAFRHSAGTRVDYCWSQGARLDAPGTGRVPFGRELRRHEIDRLLDDYGGDEDAIYRALGLLGRPGTPPMPLDRTQSHGAAVMDLMAGDWADDTAAQVRIIAVDLPATATWETSGFGTDMFMLAALHYIFDRASRIAADCGLPDTLPVVVNLSYGFSGGPHDGSGLLEAAMDEIVAARRRHAPTALVIPAGNSFQDRLTALIADDDFAQAGPPGTEAATLGWTIPSDDRTSTFAEFWMPPGAEPFDVLVEVMRPDGTLAGTSGMAVEPSPGSATSLPLLSDGRVVGQLTLDRHRDSRWRVTVILAPSDPKALPPQPGHAAAPAGAWQIRFIRAEGKTLPPTSDSEGSAPMRGAIQCRIHIDTNSLQGNTGARQSHFSDVRYEPLANDGSIGTEDGAGPIRRFGSLNGLAANRSALIVAGAFPAPVGEAVEYSSAGAMRDPMAGGAVRPFGRQVDLSAPSERSLGLAGVRAAGTRSGTLTAMGGTSVAAPQAARRLIERFLDGDVPSGPTPDNYLAALMRDADAIGTPIIGMDGPTGRARLGRLRLNPCR